MTEKQVTNTHMTELVEKTKQAALPVVMVAYIRVSSTDQNPERQHEALQRAGITPARIFEEKVSGATAERPQLQEMIAFVREGDVVYVASMDRLARSLKDLIEIVDELRKKGVGIVFLKENVRLSPSNQGNAMDTLSLHVMGAIAEFERALIKSRQREGIELAKARGVYKGRKPTDPAILDQIPVLKAQGVTQRMIAKRLGISESTVYRYLHNGSERFKLYP